MEIQNNNQENMMIAERSESPDMGFSIDNSEQRTQSGADQCTTNDMDRNDEREYGDTSHDDLPRMKNDTHGMDNIPESGLKEGLDYVHNDGQDISGFEQVEDGCDESIVDSSDLLVSEDDIESKRDSDDDVESQRDDPSEGISEENSLDAIEEGLDGSQEAGSKIETSEMRLLQKKFSETKTALANLIRNEAENLPTEYDAYVHRAISFLTDFERNETNLSHLDTDRLLQYLLTVLLYETNEILQYLHDVAEERVIRGESLCTGEIRFITELTRNYNTLFKELLPEVRPNVLNAVVELDGKDTSSKRDILREKDREREEKIAKNKEKYLSELDLAEEEITQFQEKYVRRSGEELLRCGIVVELTGLKRKLRYLFLTNYQLMVSEAVFILKRTFDLPSVSKVRMTSTSKLQAKERAQLQEEDQEDEEHMLKGRDPAHFHQFDVHVGKDKKMRFYSRDAELWINDINDAINAFMSLGKEIKRSDDSDRDLDVSEDVSEIEEPDCEIVVTVHEGIDFRQPPKKRPDNPYFFIGVGNPEHYMQDRMSRQQSPVQKGNNPKWDSTFHLKLRPSMEFSLDIRFYSKVPGARNHFCYGVVSVPLKDLFVGEERRDCIRSWYNLRYEEGTQGRAFITVKLGDTSIPDWIYDLKPPYTPIICSHNHFALYEKIPVIYGGDKKDVVGLIHSSGTTNVILDTVTKRRIYTLEKSRFACS